MTTIRMVSRSGFNGWGQTNSRRLGIIQAQFNAANRTLHPELGGHVQAEETRSFWRSMEYSPVPRQGYHVRLAPSMLSWGCRANPCAPTLQGESHGDGRWTDMPRAPASSRSCAGVCSCGRRVAVTGPQWGHNAESYFLIGKAMAKGMLAALADN